MVEECVVGSNNQMFCDDGTCFTVSTGYKCPEHLCIIGDKECRNRIQCYFGHYDTCDGSNDCDDGTDEANCPFPGSSNMTIFSLPKEVLLIILAVTSFVLLCTVLSIYIYCRRNNNNSQRSSIRGNSLRMQNEIPFVAADNIAGIHPGPPMCPSHISLPRVPCCPAHVSAVQSLLGHNGAAAPYIASEEQPFIRHTGHREWMEDFR